MYSQYLVLLTANQQDPYYVSVVCFSASRVKESLDDGNEFTFMCYTSQFLRKEMLLSSTSLNCGAEFWRSPLDVYLSSILGFQRVHAFRSPVSLHMHAERVSAMPRAHSALMQGWNNHNKLFSYFYALCGSECCGDSYRVEKRISLAKSRRMIFCFENDACRKT